MDGRKQVIDLLFFMLLSGKILFCDSESESNSDESVLTIPVGFDLNFSVEDNENNVETSDRELCHLISIRKSLTWHS
jgi:hypothetical protein